MNDRDCDNCAHHSDGGCSVWECSFEQKEDDKISRQAAIDALSQYPFEKVVNCISIIEELPSAQPERKTGKWELESESLRKDRRSRWKCSACEKHVLIGVYDDPIKAGLSFCPNCGADMRGEQNE